LRYQEIDASGKPIATDQGASVGVLYVRKSALGAAHPERLRMTIEEAR